MSKTWKESLVEGIGIAVIVFALMEFVIESVYGWTRGLLEWFRINPDAPNLLQLYYEIQMNKGAISTIVFLILLVGLKWKLGADINRWHVISIIPSSLGYFFYVFIKYSYLFPVT